MRKPLLPREHGAWGIMGGSFLSTILIIDGFNSAAWLLFASFLLFYLARYALLQSLKRRESRSACVTWLALYGSLGASSLLFATLFSGRTELALWLIGLLPFFLAEQILDRLKMRQHIVGHLVGTIALATISPLSSIYALGRVSSISLALWAVNLAFFVGEITFVRFEIALCKEGSTESKAAIYRRASMLFSILVVAASFVSTVFTDSFAMLPIVFLPWAVHSFTYAASMRPLPSIRALGSLQMAHTAIFVALAGIFL